MSGFTYIGNAGQTYMPFKANIGVKTLPYVPLDPPEPPIPALELNPAAREKGWVIQAQSQHFLPGVTAEMLDWFWANMEKGYYLWAPGSHKRFSWVKEPWRVGFVHSVHMISESVGEGHPVFGGNGIEIHRLGLDWFPFTAALEHVIVEGVFNDLDEFVDMTVHMWENCDGGARHITAAVASTTVHEPPRFVKEMLAEDPESVPVAPASTDHGEYEASRWPVFLPGLYKLWEGHPDPTQSVPCDLRVTRQGAYQWAYVCENGPVTIHGTRENETMYEIGKVLHAGISVYNMRESLEWYSENLGFQLVKDDGYVPPLDAHICFVEKDGFQIELFEYKQPKPLPSDRLTPNSDLQTVGTKHVAFAVKGMDELKARLIQNGTAIAHETEMNGEHVLFIRDCNGVLIELVENG